MGNAIVTDAAKPQRMISDQTLNLKSLKGKFDTDAYLSPSSDIVALMVFEHQMHMVNLFTRVGWEVRFTQYQERIDKAPGSHDLTEGLLRDTARELVDYMLFVDEARRGATLRQDSWQFGFRRNILCAGLARQQRTFVTSIQSRTAAHALPLQLHDLFRGLRWHARASQRSGLQTDVADSFGGRTRE
jgi:hypothetical protein